MPGTVIGPSLVGQLWLESRKRAATRVSTVQSYHIRLDGLCHAQGQENEDSWNPACVPLSKQCALAQAASTWRRHSFFYSYQGTRRAGRGLNKKSQFAKISKILAKGWGERGTSSVQYHWCGWLGQGQWSVASVTDTRAGYQTRTGERADALW